MVIALINEWFSFHEGAMERCRSFSIALAKAGHEVHVFCVGFGVAQAPAQAFGTDLKNLTVHWMPVVDLMEARGELPDPVIEQLGGESSFPVEFCREYAQLYPPDNEGYLERISQKMGKLLNDIHPDVIQVGDDVWMLGPGLRQVTGIPICLLSQAYEICLSVIASLKAPIALTGRQVGTYAEILPSLQAAASQYDSIWAVSHYWANQVQREMAVPSEKIEVHYAGVTLDDFDTQPPPGYADRFGVGDKVLFLGRVDPNKGPHHLLSAFPMILQAHPETSLLIAGSDEVTPGYIGSMRHLVDNMKLGQRVFFTGFVEGQERRNVFASCDVFVQPLLVPESAGITPLEAMASGKPVVASRLGWNPELITPELGLLYDPFDTRALADAVLELLNDKDRREQMGAAARQFVEQNLTWEHQVDLAIELFEDMLSR